MSKPLATATEFGVDRYEKTWESVSGGNLFAGDKTFTVERSLRTNVENLASRDNS